MAETLLYQGVPVNPVNGLRLRLGFQAKTLAGDHTVGPQDAQFLAFDPDGSDRDITVPAEEVSQGRFMFIGHSGSGNTLQVKTDGGVNVGTTIAAGAGAWFVCDGSSWIKF